MLLTAVQLDTSEAGLDEALALTDRMDEAYRATDDESRRLFNQGVFEPFKVLRNEVVDPTPREPFLSLTTMLPRNDETAAPSLWDGGLNFLHMVETGGIEPPSEIAPEERLRA